MQHDLRHFIPNDHSPSTTWNNLYTFGLDIVTALSQIHQEDLVHKDLHSGNVLQRPDSVWVIADLGFCGPPTLPSEKLYGCMPYLAPELLFSLSSSVHLPYTPASDIYSFGMLIYEGVTGQAPFRNMYQDPKELATAVCKGIRPKIPDSLPDHIVSLMEQCWKADPSERPTSAQLLTYFVSQCSANQQFLITAHTGQLDQLTERSQIFEFGDLPAPKNLGVY